MNNYNEFLQQKIKLSQNHGFEVPADKLRPGTLPHQPAMIQWMVRQGKWLLGASFGLTKTYCQIEALRLIQEAQGGQVLIICPLGVKSQFQLKDGPRLGVEIEYVTTEAEALAAKTPFLITNYERVRDGGFSEEYCATLTAVTLDEGNTLRSLGTKTYQVFKKLFANVKNKGVASATPAPNEYLEILNYADWLDIMDKGQALTRWFKRDTQKAGHLTIHPHLEEEFWLWVFSWALLFRKPSTLGFSDKGYDMPELKVEWHRLHETEAKLHIDTRGQVEAFKVTGGDLREGSKEKRRTLTARVALAADIVNSNASDKHWVLWHHLEDERKVICEALPEAVAIYGGQDLETKEDLIMKFSNGEYRILATKPQIAGSGCNFQFHCSDAIFLGINDKFNDFIQAIHRIYRFQQTKQVTIHIIYSEAEESTRQNLERKWAQHNELMAQMEEIIKTHGINQRKHLAYLTRTIGCEREEIKGRNFTAIRNDNVEEMPRIASNTIGLIHTSIPFGNHYEYSASYNDFGHNESDEKFFEQMDFLTPEMHRVLMPGRIAAIHVKDRIHYGTVTGKGMSTVHPFHAYCLFHYLKHGFEFLGMVTIETDVVRENNQTYRLTYSEMLKDGSKMGVGSPEYLLIFRKPQTDKSKAYADLPVTKGREDYSLGQWQIDARAKWNSSGNRLLSVEELAALPLDVLQKRFSLQLQESVYDYQFHVHLAETLDAKGKLPKTWEALKVDAKRDYVWSDINRMRTLNSNQTQNKERNHICPLQLDIVERVITRYSNPGEIVLDPFGGIMTVPVTALKLNRKGHGIELNADYFRCGAGYCRDFEATKRQISLFDLFEEKQQEVAA